MQAIFFYFLTVKGKSFIKPNSGSNYKGITKYDLTTTQQYKSPFLSDKVNTKTLFKVFIVQKLIYNTFALKQSYNINSTNGSTNMTILVA